MKGELFMSVKTELIGKSPKGKDIRKFIITNASGASVSVMEWGAIVTSIVVPDAQGKMDDIALGFDHLEDYIAPHGSMGDCVGRYGNRIGKGRFILDGVSYQLALNEKGKQHLHGGKVGFAAHYWAGTAKEGSGIDSVRFTRVSPDGEENYPGNLDVAVTYSWDNDCNLSIHYEAVTDKPTLCNLTNHTYFNLGGHASGSVRNHEISIDADVITKVDQELIPTGEYMPVFGTPLDLRDSELIGDGLESMQSCPQMVFAGGYDHNYLLRKGFTFGRAAVVFHEDSGRYMEVLTDQPAIQFYSACQTDFKNAKGGADYGKYSGLCLETQHCPDSPNHPNFPGTTVLRPGEKYDTTTIYAFRTL